MANVMGKEKKESDNTFAKGGSTKMFGQQDASPAMPGTSSPANGKGSPNNKFGIPTGTGKGKMVGKQAADPQAPGVSGHAAGTSQNWGVKGGTTKMFGKQTANTALPGTSSPRNG
jgi:hypothetical protein